MATLARATRRNRLSNELGGVWFDRKALDRLKALRGPAESYCDVILKRGHRPVGLTKSPSNGWRPHSKIPRFGRRFCIATAHKPNSASKWLDDKTAATKTLILPTIYFKVNWMASIRLPQARRSRRNSSAPSSGSSYPEVVTSQFAKRGTKPPQTGDTSNPIGVH